jgi:hypothetical protein
MAFLDDTSQYSMPKEAYNEIFLQLYLPQFDNRLARWSMQATYILILYLGERLGAYPLSGVSEQASLGSNLALPNIRLGWIRNR